MPMLLATTAIAPAPWVKLPAKPVPPSTAVEVVLTVGAAWLVGPTKLVTIPNWALLLAVVFSGAEPDIWPKPVPLVKAAVL